MKSKEIVLLATGGTIASVGDSAKGDLVAKLKGEALAEALIGKTEMPVNICVDNYSTINSTGITPEEMIRMAEHINTILRRDEVSAVVVTHGTSLMEETAFVLDLLVDPSDKPVVITGAQRDSSYAWSDGQSNLSDAINVAIAEESAGMGVMAVFCGNIYEGRRLKKSHSLSLDAFSSGEHGILGHIYYGKVMYLRQRSSYKLPMKSFEPCSVAILPFYSGADGRYIDKAVESGEKGIVVEGVGCGNVNARYCDSIMAAMDANIPVVMTTRCTNSYLAPLYAYKGGGAYLNRAGAILSNLPAPQARLLLMMLIGANYGKETIADVFSKF